MVGYVLSSPPKRSGACFRNGGLALATVEPALTHTPRWMAQAMGYERLWAIAGQFWCKFRFGGGPNLWVMGVYGLLQVWVMTGSTVCSFLIGGSHDKPMPKIPLQTMDFSQN